MIVQNARPRSYRALDFAFIDARIRVRRIRGPKHVREKSVIPSFHVSRSRRIRERDFSRKGD